LGEFERDVDENLKLAVQYSIPNLVVFSGNRRVGQTDDESIEVSAKALAGSRPPQPMPASRWSWNFLTARSTSRVSVRSHGVGRCRLQAGQFAFCQTAL